jgi:hypothetical protein
VVEFLGPPSPANWGERSVTGAVQVYRRKLWFPLRFNQLAGVRWRGRLLGPGGAVAELRTPWPFLVYDVFWLLSFGLYVPVPTPLAPVVPPGACAPEKSSPALLRR